MHVICVSPLRGLLPVSLVFGGVMSAFHMEQENHSGNPHVTFNNPKFILLSYTVLKD